MRQSTFQKSAFQFLAVQTVLKARGIDIVARLRRSRMGAFICSTRGLIAGLEVVLVILCAHQASKLFWVVTAPSRVVHAASSQGLPSFSAPVAPALNALNVTTTDMFRRPQALTGQPESAAVAPATTLNVQLFGVRSNTQGQSSAIIRRPDNTQDVFVPGQQIIDGVMLESIEADRVVIRRMGVLESLYLDQGRAKPDTAIVTQPPISQTNADETDAPRRRISADPMQLFAAIEVVPGKTAAGADGLLVRPRGDAALFQEAGLQSGDVLLTVNGQKVADASRLPRLIQGLSAMRSFTIEIDRAGQTLTQRLVVDR